MLKSLSIKNYALIESLDIDFEKGFSVITGETGAGKSILLGAIGLLIGSRADTSAIRAGAPKCTIEGVFDITSYDLRPLFEENDMEYDDECIIRRELLASGKSRAFVNDSPASLAQLKALGNRLIDIHSQHQNLLLGAESFQLNVLDTLAGNNVERDTYAAAFDAYHHAAAALKKAEEESVKNKADEDFIRFQQGQLKAADLHEGEQDELEEEQQMLEHAEDIKTDLYTVCNQLDNDEASLLSALKESTNRLQSLSSHFPKAEEWAERAESVLIELRDIVDEVSDACETVNVDPERQQEVEERLSLIYTLQKKHHVNTVEELMAIEADLSRRLASIDNSDEHLEDLRAELKKARKGLTAAATQLTATRQKASDVLAKGIVERLIDLGMPNIRFEADVTPRTAPERDGMDTVTFRFSSNKSSPLQDIAEVASGGEIARVMLAIKAMTAASRRLPTIIFDEIDTGISGHIADRMGIIMKEMGAHDHQIISITHLPQIAAHGSVHYRVSKHEGDSGTITTITRLEGDDRVREIAAMMSGATLTEAAIANAKALLSHE